MKSNKKIMVVQSSVDASEEGILAMLSKNEFNHHRI